MVFGPAHSDSKSRSMLRVIVQAPFREIAPRVRLRRGVAWVCSGHVTDAVYALNVLAQAPGMRTYQAYWAATGAILATAGLPDGTAAYDRAIGLTGNPGVRAFLLARLGTAVALRELGIA